MDGGNAREQQDDPGTPNRIAVKIRHDILSLAASETL